MEAEIRMKVGFSGKDGDVAVLLRRNLSTSRSAALEMSPWALKSPLELKSPARMIPRVSAKSSRRRMLSFGGSG